MASCKVIAETAVANTMGKSDWTNILMEREKTWPAKFEELNSGQRSLSKRKEGYNMHFLHLTSKMYKPKKHVNGYHNGETRFRVGFRTRRNGHRQTVKM